MKTSILLFLTAILFSTHVNAQHYNKKVALYYQYKNKAELAIIDSNYLQANQFYQQAFALKFPFPTDLNNAFIVSYMTQDSVLAQKYYNNLVLHGWKKEHMEKSKYFFDQIIKQPFYLYLSRNYDSLWDLAIHSEMPIRAKEMDSIHAIDQAARSNGENMTDKAYFEQIKKGDQKAIVLFLQHIQKHGFPNFNQIGFYDGIGMHPFAPGTPFIMYWHQRGPSNFLESLFYNAVMNGDLIADQYAITADKAKERYYMVLPKFEHLDSAQIKSKLAVINKERAKIYLESIEDYSRKLVFQAKNKQFYFVNFFTFAFNAPSTPVSAERSAELNKKFHVPEKTKKRSNSVDKKQDVSIEKD